MYALLRTLALCAAFAAALAYDMLPLQAQPSEGSWNRLQDLRGPWLFRIGDSPRWADPDLDDAGWDEVFVPARWEDEGFPGYDGIAWYRRHFRFDTPADGRSVYLHVGRIDDADQVFVNGTFVGATGGFPPDDRTAYQVFRTYRIPAGVLRPGKDNVVAVRVFDGQLEGGILEGRVGLYEREDLPPMVADLTGTWDFRTGDDPSWKDEKVPERGWSQIQVPGFWEAQGFEDYDGMAWYRIRFPVPASARGDDFVLLLGQIDDLDEAYLNGVRVGSTGDMRRRRIDGDEYRRFRAYPIPEGVLHAGVYNTLAVRVYDGRIDGGMYGGPFGIVRRDAFERWRRKEGGAWGKVLEWLRDWE